MAKKRKSIPHSTPQPPSGTPSPSDPKPPKRSKTWFETHGRDLRFLAIFVILMVIYYAFSTTSTMKDRFFPWYLKANASASVTVLKAVGYSDVKLDQKSVISSRGSITVERGCDAIEPSALFVSAVLASPLPITSRLLAATIGTAVLLSINLFRIISLFLCAVHWKSAFDVMHLDVWQALFIFLSILAWAVWAAWAVRRQRQRNAQSTT